MQLLKKMSAKTICGNPILLFTKEEMPDPKDAKKTIKRIPLGIVINLFRVIGMANGVKKGTSNFGDWISFSGQFQAISYETGETFRSNALFLPPTAQDALLPVVMEHGDNGVQFGFDVAVRSVEDKQDPSNTKYEYVCRPLMQIEELDAIKAFRDTLPPLLEAPRNPSTAVEGEKTATASAPTAPAKKSTSKK